MKVSGRLVGKAQLIRQTDRVTKLIFSSGEMGGMFFCNESVRVVSEKCTID